MINGSEVHVDMYDDRLEIYSPGGMLDGSNIQERDPVTVPSTRRNPVLADVFNRLGYMERKGSGFAKILDNYAFQVNYTDEKKPYFRSDRYQFTVIMPNLNYRGTQDGTQDFDTLIMNMIEENNKISAKIMAEKLGVSLRTVRRLIKENDQIEYVGHGFSGYWKIK